MAKKAVENPLACVCGAPGNMIAARVLTDDEFRRFTDRENPEVFQPGHDTANPRQRAELGALHRCAVCGYTKRVPAGEPAAAAAGE